MLKISCLSLFVLLSVGCSTARTYQDKDYDGSKHLTELFVGMDKNQVMQALGYPLSTCGQDRYVVYQYEWTKPGRWEALRVQVLFENDFVSQYSQVKAFMCFAPANQPQAQGSNP